MKPAELEQLKQKLLTLKAEILSEGDVDAEPTGKDPTEVTDEGCVCSFEAHGQSGLVGRGVFVQRYVPRGKLEAAARQRLHGG